MSLGVWDFLLIQNVQRLKKKSQILAMSFKECMEYDGSLCEMNIMENFISGGELNTLEIHELPILE